MTRLRALRGPNYWRLAPVVACDVRLGALEGVGSAEIPGFAERLLAAMPSLHEHPCSGGTAGGFVERLERGMHLPHILEHVALEFQTLAGTDVHFGRVAPSGDASVWWVIVEYGEEEVGLESMRQGAELVRACIRGDGAYDTDAAVARLVRLHDRVRLDPSTSAIVEEARRRGIPVRRLNSRPLVQLGLGRALRRVQGTATDLTSFIGAEIARSKEDTRRVLEQIGLPVPEWGVADALDDALATGRDHRVLVVGGRVVACAERVSAHVVGDGARSVRALIDDANRDPRRGRGHAGGLTVLPRDAPTEESLARRGYTLDSVPAAGETVVLRTSADLSTGGTSIDRTDEMHPDNVAACEMAAGVVGLDVAGIDVLTPNISVPFRENGAVIIEVNAAPGIRMHTHPAEGAPRNVAAPIVDLLFAPGQPTSIPVIAVTGTNGKTTTTRLIAHLFRHTGVNVGFTTTDGVYLGDRLVIEGDMTGPFSANVILSNPAVDVAVLETARGGLLRAGLGFDACDVGVVLNVSADHLGLRGIHTVEQLADAKAVVPAVAKRDGHAVLNADDPLVYAMRERTDADVVLFSTRAPGENPAFDAHVARGGTGARIEGDTFVVHRGRLRVPIAPVRDVPLMLGGAARFQAQNVLAGVLAAYVRGMREDDVRAGLLTFVPSTALTPGRVNILRLGGKRVIVDYGHNPAAVEGVIDFVRRLDAVRRVGVVSGPGDRRDEDLRALGRLTAALDHVIVKEDTDRRGRRPGEIAALIREGLLEGGLPAERIEIVLGERDAVQRALDLMNDGDLAIIAAVDVRNVLDMLKAQGAHG